MENFPEKPKKYTGRENEKIVNSAKGADVIHSKTGSLAAHEQLGKGPEKRTMRITKDTQKTLNKIFEKELVVDRMEDKIEKEIHKLCGMYESKENQLHLKEDKLEELRDQMDVLKEQLSAIKYAEKYLRKDKPAEADKEIMKMEPEKRKIEEKIAKQKPEIRKIISALNMDWIGLKNLGKKIRDFMNRNNLIERQ
jgi:hypothetical protein